MAGGVPDPHRAVLAGAGQRPAVRAACIILEPCGIVEGGGLALAGGGLTVVGGITFTSGTILAGWRRARSR